MSHVTLDITGTQFNWILGSLRLAARVAADAGGLGAQPENEVFTDGEGNTPTHAELEDLADAINAGEFSVVRQGCNVDADVSSIFDTLLARVETLHPGLHQQLKSVTNVLFLVFAKASDKLAANRPSTRNVAMLYAEAFSCVATRVTASMGGGRQKNIIVQVPPPPYAKPADPQFDVVYARTPVAALYARTQRGDGWIWVDGALYAGFIVPAPSTAKFVNATPFFADLAAVLAKTGASYSLESGLSSWTLRAANNENSLVPMAYGADIPTLPEWPFCGMRSKVLLDAGETAWKDAGPIHESQR